MKTYPFSHVAKYRLDELDVACIVVPIIVIVIVLTPLIMSLNPPYLPVSGARYTFHTLKGNSTVIVVASVVSFQGNITGKDSGGNPYYAGTDLQLNVESYVKGSGPQTIYVVDIPEPSPQEPRSPPLRIGQQYVLFMALPPPCSGSEFPPCPPIPTPHDITYAIAGGPQGEFVVKNDLVYGMKTLYPLDNRWILVDANGTSVTQFVTMVQAA